jgi:hypothetical protein
MRAKSENSQTHQRQQIQNGVRVEQEDEIKEGMK